jgi:hypothetical protein
MLDFNALRNQVIAAAKQAFSEIAAAHPKEKLCAFALYTDDGAMTLCPSTCTRSFLDAKAAEDPDDYLYYKYSTSEWPFEMAGAEQEFNAISKTVSDGVSSTGRNKAAFVKFRASLIEMCITSLEELRREFFKEQGEDFILLVAISDLGGLDTPKQEKRMVARLNSPAISREFSRWLDSQ